MSLMSYFNYYFPFFRGNIKRIDCFNSPYNKEIKVLSEGFDFLEEFKRLIQAYSNDYGLNNSELSFMINVLILHITNLKKYIRIESKLENYEILTRLANSYIKNFKESISNLKIKCNVKYLKNQCILLSLDIAEMKPIYEAVVLRICATKLLETFIKKRYKNHIN